MRENIPSSILRAIHAYILDHKLDSISFDDFMKSVTERSYVDIPELALFDISKTVKFDLNKIVQQTEEGSYELPEIPSSRAEKKDDERQARIKELQDSVRSLRSVEIGKHLADLDRKRQALPKKPSTYVAVENEQNDTPSRKIEDKDDFLKAVQEEHVVVQHTQQQTEQMIPQQQATTDRTPDRFENEEILSTRREQLQEIRRQVHEERKKLHEIQTLITNSVTSITDPSILHVVKELQEKEDRLVTKERLIDEQRAVAEHAIHHAEQRLLHLKDEENKIRQTLLSLEHEKHNFEKNMALMQAKSLEKESEYKIIAKQYDYVKTQLRDAENLYAELNKQAQNMSDEIKASREDLVSWESEIESREAEIAEKEKQIRFQLQKERQQMHARLRDAEKNYKDRVRALEAKENALENQKLEIIALREDLMDVRKTLQKEKLELETRNKDMRARDSELERREIALYNRERNLDKTAEKSLEYVEQKKRELQDLTISQESDIEQRLIALHEKEMKLVKLEQELIARNNHLKKKEKVTESPKSMKQQEQMLRRYANEIQERHESLENYDFVIKKDAPDPKVDGVPMPGASRRDDDILTPSISNDSDPTIEELESLLSLAETEVMQDVKLARVTYNQLRERYHKLPSLQKERLFSRMMKLYETIQNRTVISS